MIYVYNSFYQLFFLIIYEVLVPIACEDTVLVIRLCLIIEAINLNKLLQLLLAKLGNGEREKERRSNSINGIIICKDYLHNLMKGFLNMIRWELLSEIIERIPAMSDEELIAWSEDCSKELERRKMVKKQKLMKAIKKNRIKRIK